MFQAFFSHGNRNDSIDSSSKKKMFFLVFVLDKFILIMSVYSDAMNEKLVEEVEREILGRMVSDQHFHVK